MFSIQLLAMLFQLLVFAYLNGDSSTDCCMSAASYLSFSLRIPFGKGSGIWHFVAGTADSVITPIYCALKKRGVKFKFFHKVLNLHLNKKKTAIESIEMRILAELKNKKRRISTTQKVCYPWKGKTLSYLEQ